MNRTSDAIRARLAAWDACDGVCASCPCGPPCEACYPGPEGLGNAIADVRALLAEVEGLRVERNSVVMACDSLAATLAATTDDLHDARAESARWRRALAEVASTPDPE
jgi:hypothetical protein